MSVRILLDKLESLHCKLDELEKADKVDEKLYFHVEIIKLCVKILDGNNIYIKEEKNTSHFLAYYNMVTSLISLGYPAMATAFYNVAYKQYSNGPEYEFDLKCMYEDLKHCSEVCSSEMEDPFFILDLLGLN